MSRKKKIRRLSNKTGVSTLSFSGAGLDTVDIPDALEHDVGGVAVIQVSAPESGTLTTRVIGSCDPSFVPEIEMSAAVTGAANHTLDRLLPYVRLEGTASGAMTTGVSYSIQGNGPMVAVEAPPPSDVGEAVFDTSRTTGVAPLAVFFDATAMTADGVSNPFHELFYEWDFGDSGAYMPTSTGPVAAHVFDGPGDYDVTLTVSDSLGNTWVKTTTITATNPDTVFSGTNTICVSTSGTFTGAPSGCTQVTSSNFNTAISTYAASGKRVLFRRGETFTSDGVVTMHGTTISVGAFGTGSSPDERGIYANNPIIDCQNGDVDSHLAWYGDDIRVYDLAFIEGTGADQSAACSAGAGRATNVLVHRCYTEGFRAPIGLSHDLIELIAEQPHEAFFLSQCHLKDARVNTIYIGGKYLAMLGTWADHNDLSHLFRVTFGDGVVVDNCNLDNPGTDRLGLKLHAQQNRTNYNDYTEKVVVRRCTFQGIVPYFMSIAPQDVLSNEWVRDVIVDGCTLIQGQASNQYQFYISASNVTIRNCIAYKVGTAIPCDTYFATLSNSGPGPDCDNVWIYNNTLVSTVSAGGRENAFLVLDSSLGSTIYAYNNAMYISGGGSSWFVYPGGGSLSGGGTANILNTGLTFENIGALDFRPASDSSALGAGTATFAHDDALGVYRTHDDVGAYERA